MRTLFTFPVAVVALAIVWSGSNRYGALAADDSSFASPIVNREIQVSVQAPWPSSPYNVFCEAYSFLGNDPRFLESLAASESKIDWCHHTYAEATAHALEIATQAGISNPLLAFALSMRAQSPTCELHRSLAEDLAVASTSSANLATTNAFALVNGQVYVRPEDLPEVLPPLAEEDLSSYLLSKDKPLVSESSSKSVLVILYANLGSPEFSLWYQHLTTKKPDWALIVRHWGGGAALAGSTSSMATPTTSLQGYGVRLDIRNVEYKVFDERKTMEDDDHKSSLVAVENAPSSRKFLAGVNLTALGLDGDEGQGVWSELWKAHEAQREHSQMIPPGWQRRQLGLQAATAIVQAGTKSGSQLEALQEVSQNLPSVASTLVHMEVPDEIAAAAEPMEGVLHSLIKQSGGGLFINGKPMVVERGSFNVFEMIQRLAKEQQILESMNGQLGPLFPADKAHGALELIQSAWTQGEDFFQEDDENKDDPQDEMTGGPPSKEGLHKHVRIDVASGQKGAVMFVNDIEKDRAYQHWPTRMEQAMMAMQFGMPPSVRKNLFTILAVDDPLSAHEAGNIGKNIASQLMRSEFPLRLAVLTVDERDTRQCAKWVREMKPDSGEPCPNKGGSWLDKGTTPSISDLKNSKATARDIHRLLAFTADQFEGQREILQAYEQYFGPTLTQSPPSNGRFVSVYDALSIHSDILYSMQVTRSQDSPIDMAKSLLAFDESDGDFEYFAALRFAVDKGLKPGMSFLNGRPLPAKGDEDAQEEASNIIMEEQQAIFGMIMKREITDTSPRNLYKKILSPKAKNVFPKVHPLFTSSADDSYIDLKHPFGHESLLVPATMSENPIDKDAIVVVEAFLELDTRLGRKLAKEFVEAMESMQSTSGDSMIALAYRVLPSTKAASLSPHCGMFAVAASAGPTKIIESLADESAAASAPCSNMEYLSEGLPSSNFISANGRVFEIEEISIDSMDLELLISIHLDHSVPVTKLLKDQLDASSPYEAIGRTTAFLSAAQGEGGSRMNPIDAIASIEAQMGLDDNPLRFSWNDDCEGDSLKMSVTAVVDPTSETAQRLSPLLRVIRDDIKLPLTLVLAPTVEIESDSKIPISSYYRFVADPNALQGEDNFPAAHFSNLPHEHVLTIRMDVPEPWDIQQTRAIQDTDNLRCSLQHGCGDSAAKGEDSDDPLYQQRHLTEVEYGLEHLLFSGQCYDTNSGPPNGLQLTLSPHNQHGFASTRMDVEIGADGSVIPSTPTSTSHYSDTLVMKTVGYWQLRANPGVWDLNFFEGSKGEEIYDMVEGQVKRGMVRVDGPNENDNTKFLEMGDFVTRSTTLLVERKAGQENANLLADTSTLDDEEDVVHVFSLATGHLYERLLKIMMLSVTKRTSTKVKFWLFENFLSPTFKASARAMADRIGCEVEFVTYKWPEWLRGQTEKQRIIWGYKILFLDVLFPLNVKKIIYVDADQVIRGDLKELRDMDLQGAPYGYTPMCDSREATIGYAFWKTGFWETHLRGKPYHISALYVVDLERFRKTLVGDQLRAVYQQLSADPNSLSNLDQDLPNYAQHSVPIFSLPQEWLWCESWCSDETKPTAKTIDLCNNPMHKEPKLSMAKRIINGELFEESWEELDAEVDAYDKEYFATTTKLA